MAIVQRPCACPASSVPGGYRCWRWPGGPDPSPRGCTHTGQGSAALARMLRQRHLEVTWHVGAPRTGAWPAGRTAPAAAQDPALRRWALAASSEMAPIPNPPPGSVSDSAELLPQESSSVGAGHLIRDAPPPPPPPPAVLATAQSCSHNCRTSAPFNTSRRPHPLMLLLSASMLTCCCSPICQNTKAIA